MKKSAENKILNSKLTWSQIKSLNLVNPLAREFNFELWANLVRSQMQATLRH